jgi:hypothetical protein
MSLVRTLLRQRKAEVTAAMDAAVQEAVRKASEPFLDELREIDVALYAIETSERPDRTSPQQEPLAPRQVTRSVGLTLKQMILQILGERHGGLDALAILDEINRRWNVGLERTSLSPQLSRLKQEGRLKLTGKVWNLVEKDETPGAEAPGARTVGVAGSPGGPEQLTPTGSTPVASTE